MRRVQLALADCVASELETRLKGRATKRVLAKQVTDDQLREQFVAAAQEDKLDKQVCALAGLALRVQGREQGGVEGA